MKTGLSILKMLQQMCYSTVQLLVVGGACACLSRCCVELCLRGGKEGAFSIDDEANEYLIT